jgi:hypothetical protein
MIAALPWCLDTIQPFRQPVEEGGGLADLRKPLLANNPQSLGFGI